MGMAASLHEALSFGRYEPLFRVAAGGMAEVYAARIHGEAGFQKLLAVKRMLPHLAREPGFIDMFLNEAKLAAHVASPHVVQTLDLGRSSDGSLYIVMELVVGLSLAALLEPGRAPIPLPVGLELLAQAAQGLDDAHEARTPAGDRLGLVHRDVSPHNILVGVDGRARVTDFGIARAVHRPRAETNVRELKGKFAYMSPEQTRLEPLDRRSDVFSMGIVLWELTTGQRLFERRDPLESVRLVQRQPIEDPRSLRPELPEAISAVVMRALDRDRERRFQAARDLAVALRRAARDAYGEPPQPRELGAFVEAAGGEELERLRRLIRLGTEGAALETLEAEQPGVTRVLPEDASGIAVLGTGARRTARVAHDGPPTLTRPTASGERERTGGHEHSSRERPTTLFARPVGPPPGVSTGEVTRLAKLPPEAIRVAPAPRPGRGPLIALAATVALALALGVLAAVVVVRPATPRDAAVLPRAEPMAPLPSPVPVAPAAAEVLREPELPAAEPMAEPAGERVDEPSPAVGRPRRGARPERASPSLEPRPVRERPRSTPLLDVSEFDRRSR